MSNFIKTYIGKLVAYGLTVVTTFVVSKGWISEDYAVGITLAVAPTIIAFIESALKWLADKAFASVNDTVRDFVKSKMIEAEAEFGSGNGERKKAFVVNTFVEAYQLGGFDIPWVPNVVETQFVKRIASIAVEQAMPWLQKKFSLTPPDAAHA